MNVARRRHKRAREHITHAHAALFLRLLAVLLEVRSREVRARPPRTHPALYARLYPMNIVCVFVRCGVMMISRQWQQQREWRARVL